MRRQNTVSDTLFTTRGVSPVVGATLMVALVVIFTTMISGVILSQYNTPQNPPNADLRFDQNTHSNINQTSNIRITIIEDYNSQQINISSLNESVNLYQKDGTPFLAYKTTNTSACTKSSKNMTYTTKIQGETVTINKDKCILTPDDLGYNKTEAQGQDSGEVIYICHVNAGTQFQAIAINDYAEISILNYKVRYVNNLHQFSIQPKYDNPCEGG